MPATFETTWRQVRLSIPGAPVFLVRSWCQRAYNQLADSRGWGWLVQPFQLPWNDARVNLSVGVTRGSPTVTSVGLFSNADLGRQFRVGSFPFYTIIAVPDANTLTLDQAYYGGATDPAATATIADMLATLPVNFSRFVIVTDPDNQRIVPWWATQEELSLIDPTRSSADSNPRLLVAASLSTYPPTLGQVQYEYWPKPTAAGALQGYLVTKPMPLADAAPWQGVLATRDDVIVEGALAHAAAWPGTAEAKNPYFDLALARYHTATFEALQTQLDLRDDDQYFQSWNTIPWQKWNSWAWAYNTHLLQATDATLGDYWPGTFGLGW